MREIICLTAPAILMIILVHVFTKKKMEIIELFFELIIFMVLNNACLFLILEPFDKIGLVLGEHGEMSVYYGGVAILASIIVAVGLSALIIYVYKNIKITLRIEDGMEENR